MSRPPLAYGKYHGCGSIVVYRPPAGVSDGYCGGCWADLARSKQLPITAAPKPA